MRRLGAARGRGDGAARPPAHARVRGRRARPTRSGNPWALDRSAGGSSGGSASGARRPDDACRDGHRHGRLAAHPLGVLRHLDDQADARARLDARDRAARGRASTTRARWRGRVEDCALLLAGMAGVGGPVERARRSPALRLGSRSRIGELDADVGRRLRGGARRAAAASASELVDAPPAPDDARRLGELVLLSDMLGYHRRFDGRRELYRPSIRQFVEHAESARAGRLRRTARRSVAADAEHWARLVRRASGSSALLEPTVPIVARPRGSGYDEAGQRRRR